MTAPASSSNTTVQNSSSSSSIHANVIPSEVGWQFVPQYYTFVNKQPNRLHCFYTKNSTFIHGTEGEDGRPCFGQQEIHNKILSIGFQDCKVFIHSVDAQSSANGGIIIQVIGEMSNRGEPWRKFAQTFFLAEQPNGYFVLNDIFRFLKEEAVEADDDEQSEAEPAATPAPVVTEPTPAQVAQENTDQPAAPAVQAGHPTVAAASYDMVLPDHLQPSHGPVPPGPAQAKPAEPAEYPAPLSAIEEKKGSQPNGIHPSAPTEQEPTPPAPAAAPPSVPPAEPPKQDPAHPPAAAPGPPSVEPPVQPSTAPSSVVPPVSAPAPVAATAPAPTAKPTPTPSPKPTAPKTWANLAAANSNKWGPQVAQEARGVTAPAPAAQPVKPAERSGPASAEKDGRDGSTTRELHPLYQAALSVSTPQCFVKSVTEVVSHTALSGTLTTRFGPIKELEIVRNKACAFLEFTTLDAARRAIVASLPISAGGEGGVRIETDSGGSARITVETRKERSERPPPRPRTGVPPGGQQGQDRGGFRGGAPRGRGGAGRGGGGGGGGAGKP